MQYAQSQQACDDFGAVAGRQPPNVRLKAVDERCGSSVRNAVSVRSHGCEGDTFRVVISVFVDFWALLSDRFFTRSAGVTCAVIIGAAAFAGATDIRDARATRPRRWVGISGTVLVAVRGLPTLETASRVTLVARSCVPSLCLVSSGAHRTGQGRRPTPFLGFALTCAVACRLCRTPSLGNVEQLRKVLVALTGVPANLGILLQFFKTSSSVLILFTTCLIAHRDPLIVLHLANFASCGMDGGRCGNQARRRPF